jgi:methionyl-tRNA formyltransferase
VSILFAGTPSNAADTLRQLVHAGVPITLVLTRPDAPVGRNRVLTASPVAIVAGELGIPTLKSSSVDSVVAKSIVEAKIDLAIVVAFGVLLKTEALAATRLGWFNLHYSLLPKWRGAAPVQRALLNGETETGVTLFKIDLGLDTGNLVASVPTRIEPTDNADTLLTRLSQLGVTLLLQELPGILSETTQLFAQDQNSFSVASKIQRSEAQLNFDDTAKRAEWLVRGCNPEPGAWTTTNKGLELKIHQAFSRQALNLEAGRVELVDGRVFVGCLESSLELLEVQPAGKNRMSAAAWFRGLNSEVQLGSGE